MQIQLVVLFSHCIVARTLSKEFFNLDVELSNRWTSDTSCSSHECHHSNATCEMVVTECAHLPCYPIATCVPKHKSCLNKRCGRGMTCIVKSTPCSIDSLICSYIPTCVRFPQCPPNEEYRECNVKGCDPTCEDRFPFCGVECVTGGCNCKEGFVRHKGKCIRENECPNPGCLGNEIWTKCPSQCEEPTCRSIRTQPKHTCNITGCAPDQCRCKPNHVRNDDGFCVDETICPVTFDCGSPSEELKACSSLCEPTCGHNRACFSLRCGPPKCQCKEGHSRDNGLCIPTVMCPPS